jgi:hypothetical protein
MPAATLRRLGKGVAVHVPTELFTIYWRYGYPSILAWLREVFDAIQPEPLFRTDAFSYVEVALRLRGDDLLVHLVNGCGGRDLSYVGTKDLWVDEIPPLGPITCWIRCFERPGSCTWEPGSQPADVSWHEGVLKAVLPRLEIHACLQIRRWKRPA